MLLLIANIANLGADLGAMGAALDLLLPGHAALYTAAFATLCVALEAFMNYASYAAVLKWLTASLLTYVAVVFAVHVPWGEALLGTLIPTISFDNDHAVAFVAVLGTTISPYLFFWQASQEVEEEQRLMQDPLTLRPDEAPPELQRIDLDTWVGMGYSNLIAIFIIFATAATLHARGITSINTAAEAAEALRPIAGEFTFVIFACGIIGTGLLAVPVLAGSGAYAVCEAFGWTEGLDHKPRQARAFYGTIAVSTMIGLMLNFVGINPIKALYWSAVLNGLLAAPLMVAMLLIACNSAIMGPLTLPRSMRLIGWLAALVMAAASLAFFVL